MSLASTYDTETPDIILPDDDPPLVLSPVDVINLDATNFMAINWASYRCLRCEGGWSPLTADDTLAQAEVELHLRDVHNLPGPHFGHQPQTDMDLIRNGVVHLQRYAVGQFSQPRKPHVYVRLDEVLALLAQPD